MTGGYASHQTHTHTHTHYLSRSPLTIEAVVCLLSLWVCLCGLMWVHLAQYLGKWVTWHTCARTHLSLSLIHTHTHTHSHTHTHTHTHPHTHTHTHTYTHTHTSLAGVLWLLRLLCVLSLWVCLSGLVWVHSISSVSWWVSYYIWYTCACTHLTLYQTKLIMFLLCSHKQLSVAVRNVGDLNKPLYAPLHKR